MVVDVEQYCQLFIDTAINLWRTTPTHGICLNVNDNELNRYAHECAINYGILPDLVNESF